MGLTVQVGPLAQLMKDGPEYTEGCRGSLADINEVLDENGLPQHSEPEQLPSLKSRAATEGFPYSSLHHLRRFYVYARNDPDWVPSPTPDGEDPSEDPEVEDDMESHLVCHSDSEGYYVPVDFDEVINDYDEDRIEGGMLGSSYRLMEELISIAPKLGIQIDGDKLSDDEANKINNECQSGDKFAIEKTVWLTLFEAARLSIEHQAAISFG